MNETLKFIFAMIISITVLVLTLTGVNDHDTIKELRREIKEHKEENGRIIERLNMLQGMLQIQTESTTEYMREHADQHLRQKNQASK